MMGHPGGPSSPAGLVFADSVTQLGEAALGAVVVCGSHGGRYVADIALRFGVRAIIVNDAGVGLDRAGIMGLDVLNEFGIPAAAADHKSARIGDANDCFAHGILSHLNNYASSLGCSVGMSVAESLDLLANSVIMPKKVVKVANEGRYLIRKEWPNIWALDSAALTLPCDDGQLVATGSHAWLLGNREESAFASSPLAALFNDAGVTSVDRLGRLQVLDRRGIAAVAVSCQTARIGDGRSTYFDGVISHINISGTLLGGAVGQSAKEFVDSVAARSASRVDREGDSE